jgi:hypothetical protein
MRGSTSANSETIGAFARSEGRAGRFRSVYDSQVLRTITASCELDPVGASQYAPSGREHSPELHRGLRSASCTP